MEKLFKSKEIMVRLKNNSRPYDLAIKNGFTQQKNGIDIPNVNKMMNFLYDFADKLDANGISLKSLANEKLFSIIKEID